jgi:hypothetical protein
MAVLGYSVTKLHGYMVTSLHGYMGGGERLELQDSRARREGLKAKKRWGRDKCSTK